MGKRKLEYKCPNEKHGCTKKFQDEGIGMNEENFNRHVKTCKYARKEKKKGIGHYFSSRNNVGQTAVSNAIGRVSETPSTSHVAAEASNSNVDAEALNSTNVVAEASDSNVAADAFTSSDDVAVLWPPAESLINTDEIEIIEETIVTKGDERSAVLCRGYEITMDSGSVLSRYPFHRHDPDSQDISTLLHFNITLKHGVSETTLVAHAQTCNGTVFTPTLLNENINKECSELEYSPLLKKLIKIGDSDTPPETMKFDMLSFDQLKAKCRDLRKMIEKDKLETLNILRKNKTLTKQVTLNNRFLDIITGADIPRLGMLLQVCRNNGMAMCSIISRIGDAISKKYRVRKYGETDWDIATLVLRIGGPKLGFILHKTHGLPAPDSTRRHSNKERVFSVAVDTSFEKRLKTNIGKSASNNSIKTLKMDEIATESRLRWCNNDNKILGLCYQHSHDAKMTFNSMDDIYTIREEIEAGKIHRTKETLVVACGEVGNGGKIKSVLALPSCKAENDQFSTMIDATVKEMASDVIATDGDGQRRHELSNRDKIIENKDVKELLGKLPLFDLHVIDGKMALFFDDKHNSKRFRGVIISDSRGCLVDGNVISQSQLKYLFDKAGINNYRDALYPNDRQNVPAVLKLVEKINECISEMENCDDQIYKELRKSVTILVYIFDGIICIFSSPKINLCDQLMRLSTLAHILYHQYREYGTKFMPGQLYHDLQRMVQASYYSCVVLKLRGGGNMYLYQLGTDQLENTFGTVRIITHSRNCDVLELSHRLQHSAEINEIIEKHPSWKRFHGKRLGSHNDATSQSDWTGDLEVNKVDVYQMWIFGRAKACEILDIETSYFNSAPGSSMIRPKKRLVGVTVETERQETFENVSENTDNVSTDVTELSDVENDSAEATRDLEENLVSLEIEQFIEDNDETTFTATVEVEGKTKHKATVIRMMFNESVDKASADRLRRVRSYTNYPDPGESDVSGNEGDPDIELDDMIMIGDIVCGKVALKNGKACLAVAKIASIRDIPSKKFLTVSAMATMGSLQFQVKICHVRVTEEKMQILQTSSGLLTWKGSHCVSLHLTHMELEMGKAIEILKSLPIADNQRVELSSCLPYHQSLEISLEPGILSEKIPCRICGVGMSKKAMRKHVGVHIIKSDLAMVCGFCGTEGCSIDLVRGSGRGKTATLVPGGNCEYLQKFNIKCAEKSTKSGPCTNRPVTCSVCKTVQWSYNLPVHYRVKHSDHPIPTRINQEERKFMDIDS